VSRDVCMPRGGPGTPPQERPAEGRRADFRPAVEGYSREEARDEASRCLATLECLHCNVCELLCPDQCITRDPQTGAILIDLVHCKGCGLCAHYCPKGAIRMELEPTD
jgi:Pyruvate/2-oxoacid:ferredoxin oxidoreductase delta subunit